MSGTAADSRMLTLDIAKGLGIVLVVLGHNSVFREGAHPLYEAIYLFHMPLFFFLSGLTFRIGPPGEAFVKRVRSLLVPYFAMGVLAVLMALKSGGLSAATSELSGIFYGTGHSLRFVPLWFLPCLFLVSMLATLLLGGVRSAMSVETFERRRVFVLGTVAVAGLAIGSFVLVSRRFALPPFVDAMGRPLGLPWSLDLVPFALGLFVVGTLAARASLVHRCPQPWIVMLAAAGVLASLVSFGGGGSLDLNYRRMTSPGLVLLAMAAGIAMVLAASALVSRVQWSAKVFGYLGSASLIVFMVHSPLQRRVVDALMSYGWHPIAVVSSSVVGTIALIVAGDAASRQLKRPSIAVRLRTLRIGALRASVAVLSAARRLRTSSPAPASPQQ